MPVPFEVELTKKKPVAATTTTTTLAATAAVAAEQHHHHQHPALVLCLLILLCIQPGLTDIGPTKPPSAYKWKVGPWGSCHSQSKCGEGHQQRNVWCAHMDDRTSLKVLCDAAGRIPDSVRDCFQVCEEHKGKLSWRIGPWGPCLPLSQEGGRGGAAAAVHVTFHSTSRHLRGFMTRDVVCVYRRSNHSQARGVSDEACHHFEKKPDDRLPCTVPRAQDCVVTDFGEWLPCRGCGTGNHTRTRRVLVAPRHGGRPCPRLAETEPCNEAVACLQSPHIVPAFRLRIGSWSDCFSLDSNGDDPSSQYGFWPSVGYQAREVTCKDESGASVELSNCVGSKNPQVPARVRACIVPVDCLVSSWTEWTVKKEGCVTQNGDIHPEMRKRTRQVLRVPLGSGGLCPHLVESHVIEDKGKLPPCTRYKWSPTEWSDCILTDQLKIRKVLCGGGIRRRNLTCLRTEDLVPVSSHLCVEPPPTIIQRCAIPCRQDCVVSSWSTWGSCKPLDCKDALYRKPIGYQERSRAVLVAPRAEGLECPPLQQVDTCDDAACYQWRTTDFSPCLVLNKELKCGQGKQSRKAFCVDLEGIPVDEALCKVFVFPPEQTVPCYIPCPNDCVLSPWSEWSPCSRICSIKDDFGQRTRNRTVLAPSGLGGTPCPNPTELTETEICNQHSCVGFGWKVSPWQTCKVSVPSEPCGQGQQIREVFCIKDDERRVVDRKCAPLKKPVDIRNCTVPCPKDCILSKFSEWTPCKDTCSSADKNEMQERVQHVLQWPELGRPPCQGSLKETRPCPSPCLGNSPCTQSCHTYSWLLKEWGLCILPDSNTECGSGYRTRGLSCVRSDGEEVEIGLCLHHNLTIAETVQRCYIDCVHFCVFSEWSKWSSCPMSCSATQGRSRVHLREGPQAECKNVQHYPLTENRSCPCNAHSTQAEGDHSDCILDDADEVTPVNGLEVRGRCGVGRRIRRVACYDKNNNLMDPFLCIKTGYEEDACMIICPVDCEMSSWSEWSTCGAVCGHGVQHRTRRVLRPEFKGGRPCPQTDDSKTQREARLCSVPCYRYQWLAYEWTPCEMSRKDIPSQQCGTGHQSRKVKCVKVDDNNKSEPAREEFCDPVSKPVDINFCHVPCPSDCVVSDWAEWSNCRQPCDGFHTRVRIRYNERKPESMGHACPLLDEKEECSLNINCFHYAWNYTEWTLCTIPDGATCGEGVKQRGVICRRSDGRSVEDEWCEKMNVSRPMQSEVPCMVDCPIDCEVSEWSRWNHDDCKQCGTPSVSVRTRRVTVLPSVTGRPCPEQLIQRKPCPAVPCYHWQHSAWSDCELEGGQCGHGQRRREVTCRRTDGAVVNHNYCLEANSSEFLRSIPDVHWLEKLLDIQEEEPCHLPCPGDCSMSEWSEWSPCHRDCSGGEQVGVQSRSRAVEIYPSNDGEPCPRQLWETKPCYGGPCFTFSWQVRGGAVVCVRSDGINVLGGCHGKPRPCVPSCRILHSECSHSGECMCQNGYRPIYREGSNLDGPRQLVACELINLTNSSHHTAGSMAGESEVRVVYFPNDNEVSFWMYAMIAVGSAFVIFVAVTIYLMCHTSVGRGIGGGPGGGGGGGGGNGSVPIQQRNPQTIRHNIGKEAVVKP